MQTDGAYPQYFTDVQYSDHSALNTVRICIPREPSSADASKLWLIYVHGGAWYDPEIRASSFDKLQECLLNSPAVSHIRGLASIDYRLSPYPSHPRQPSDPNDPARNVRHPAHIDDVLHAILFLQEKYHFRDRYVLVGHSAGATLALQVAMRRFWGVQYESTFADELNVMLPLAIVGVDGIYDLCALVEEYASSPAYRDFVRNAFGPDVKVWEDCSPTNGEYDDSWSKGRLLWLIHSDGDELLTGRQRQIMLDKMQDSEWSKLDGHSLASHDIQGLKHDEVWQNPNQLTAVLSKAVNTIAESL